MDPALALVDAYLQVNGFFTVKEYPILERGKHGMREATDVDVLAVRLPFAGRVLPRPHLPEGLKMDVDPLLECEFGRGEYIIGEVKTGIGDVNAAMWRHSVLFEAMRRFGICGRDELNDAADRLRTEGVADTSAGRVRLIAFASRPSDRGTPHQHIGLDHVAAFLHAYIDQHWAINRQTRFRDPALGLLALLRKAG